jgi:hypothetical protein
MVEHCPHCGKKQIEKVGISSFGAIFKCLLCKSHFIDAKNTFEVGKTYWTRSVCDSECIITITVAKRTAKFLTTSEGKRLGISSWDGVEHVKPWGAYSMAPIISADRAMVGGKK